MADETKGRLRLPALKEGEAPVWALRRAAWEERQRGEEGPWFRVWKWMAEENARWWVAQRRWVREWLDRDPEEEPRANPQWPWADEREIAANEVGELARRLNDLVRAGAVLRVWDQRWKVLFMEGKPGGIEVTALRDIPGAGDLYPDCPGRIQVLDGFGARLSFRFAERPKGMADPGLVVVDIVGTIEEAPDRWVGGGLRYRVEVQVTASAGGAN